MERKNEKLQMPFADETEVEFVNPLERLLGYQLRRASLTMMGDLAAAIEDLGLRVTEMSILLVIQENQRLTQSDIGRLLAIQRANVAPLTLQLETQGLIARGTVTGRAQALHLTKTGMALANKCQARIAAHEAKFLPELSARQRGALIKVLQRIWQVQA